MPATEQHLWRSGDAASLLDNARIVGRCEGTNPDGGRYHGFIVEPISRWIGKRYAAYWHKGNFLVEEIARKGDPFVCDTCDAKGIVGRDGPFYGIDRDTRVPSVSRCRSCVTKPG